MGYLSILLTESSKKIFTIVFPFGYFECQVLPQGAKPTTDIFQSRMVGMFASMQGNRPYPYLDDIFHHKSNTFDECLGILTEIFERLGKHGMQVNLKKSELMAETPTLLGFELTPAESRSTFKRIEAILKLAKPNNKKRVRRINGIVKFIKKIYTKSRRNYAATHQFDQR